MTQRLRVRLAALGPQRSSASVEHIGRASGDGSLPGTRSMQRHTFRAIVGSGGHLSYLFGRLCGLIPGLAYARHVLVAVSTDDMPQMPRSYSTRLVSPEELADYRIDADLDVQAIRFAAGMRCLGVFNRAETLIGVTWMGVASHEETVLGVRFLLPPGTAWDGGLWIDENYRLSRAFVALWAGMRSLLEEQGLHQTISSIADYNAASVAAHRSLGATVIGHVAILRIGRIQLTFNGGLWPRWSRTGQPPEIELASLNARSPVSARV